MCQILSAKPKCDGWPWTNMDVNMNRLIIVIIIIIIIIMIIIIITVIVIIVSVMIIKIIKLWICLEETFDMNKDDDVDKNKVGALNSKAKQYSDSSSDEDVTLSGKWVDR